MNDGITLRMNEDGNIERHIEPYATVEIATEEEFNEMNELLKLGKEYRELNIKGECK